MEKTKEFTLVDKRQFPRFSVHYLADIYLHEKWLFATVIDISEGGIGIISAKPVNVGDILTLKIRCKLDNDPRANIQFDAKIVGMGEISMEGMQGQSQEQQTPQPGIPHHGIPLEGLAWIIDPWILAS